MYVPEAENQLVTDFQAIKNQVLSPKNTSNQLKIEAGFTKSAYLAQVRTMLDHIHRGDIYEANFCQEFYASGTISPLDTFTALNRISQAPFAAYFRNAEKYLLCTSPERYLRKKVIRSSASP